MQGTRGRVCGGCCIAILTMQQWSAWRCWGGARRGTCGNELSAASPQFKRCVSFFPHGAFAVTQRSRWNRSAKAGTPTAPQHGTTRHTTRSLVPTPCRSGTSPNDLCDRLRLSTKRVDVGARRCCGYDVADAPYGLRHSVVVWRIFADKTADLSRFAPFLIKGTGSRIKQRGATFS